MCIKLHTALPSVRFLYTHTKSKEWVTYFSKTYPIPLEIHMQSPYPTCNRNRHYYPSTHPISSCQTFIVFLLITQIGGTFESTYEKPLYANTNLKLQFENNSPHGNVEQLITNLMVFKGLPKVRKVQAEL